MTRPPAGRSRLAPALAGGLAAFVLGAVLALAILPEWRAGSPADPALFVREARRIAGSSGLRVLPGEPEVRLVTATNLLGDVYRQLGERAAPWLEANRGGARARVRQTVRLPGFRSYQELRVEFTLDGRPLLVEWENLGGSLFQPTDRAQLEQLSRKLATALLAPGESAGRTLRGQLAGNLPAWEMWDLEG
ncbi:MAG TPA: hypothetical protein VFR03_16860, partial [Thermoanaerobaculia bacterium]|nr:hypothetical protein [Thermoanaerobaculia bacterium]